MDIKSKLMELVGLCYEINNTTEHDVFFRFYGNVDNIEVHINEGGVNNGGDRISIINTWGIVDNVLDDINEAIEKLKEYLYE